MSRTKQERRKPAPGRDQRPSWWWLILMAAVAIGVGIWLWRTASRPKLPAIDFEKVDAPSAATIRRHLVNTSAHPRSADAWGHLGIVLRAYEFPQTALACLTEAERLDPTNPRWLYFQSLLLTESAPEVSLAKLKQTVDRCGNDPEMPRYRLASRLGEAGQWPKAIAELEILLRARPSYAPAKLVLARAEHARGNVTRAIALARECTEDSHTARGAWSLLAVLLLRQGEPDSAAEAARRAAALPPDTPVEDPFENEAAMLRGDPRPMTYQAHNLLNAGRFAEAERLIQMLLAEHSQFPETWLLAGRFHLIRKELPRAEQAFRRHLVLQPQSSQGLFQLGMTLLHQNRLLEAAHHFQQATELKPDFGPAHFNRGLALARANQYEQAITALRETVRYNPEHREAYFMLAELHLRLGDRPQAEQWLQAAAELSPADRRLPALRERSKVTETRN